MDGYGNKRCKKAIASSKSTAAAYNMIPGEQTAGQPVEQTARQTAEQTARQAAEQTAR